MLHDNKSHEGKSSAGLDSRRREFLVAIGASGIMGLAGCSGDDTTNGNGTGTGGRSDVSGVEGATLYTYVTELPAGVAWGDLNDWPQILWSLCYDVIATTDKNDTVVSMVGTDWGWSADEVRIQIRDDANWSNGKPILAKDWLARPFVSRFTSTADPTLEELKKSGPMDAWDAVTSMEFDGKTGILRSAGGWFEEFNMESWIRGLITGDWGEVATNRWGPTGKAALEMHDRIDKPASVKGRKQAQEIYDKYFDPNEQPSEDPSEGTEAITSAAWQVEEIREDEITLVPNKHHYNADQINWDRVELRVHSKPNQRWTSLNEGLIDSDPGIYEFPPPNVIDAFPDYIQSHPHSGNTQTVIYAPANQPFLNRGRVRQALMLAIQKKKLANVQHKYAASPLQGPPGLTDAGAKEWVDDQLLSSFQTYEYDTKRAAALLEQEGFTQEDGSWITPDGKPWSLALTTGSSVLKVEQGVIHDLNSFGLAVDLNTIGDTIFENRFHDGEFQLTIRDTVYAMDGEIYIKALIEEARRKKLGLFDNDRVVQWAKNSDHINRNDYDWTYLINGATAEDMKQFTVSAPPIGEPDADPTEEYPVAYYQERLSRSLPEKTRREYMQALMWVWNWKLPLLPLTRISKIAFQNHRDWIAPEKDGAWDLGYPNPLSNLMNMGKIQANPEGNHG